MARAIGLGDVGIILGPLVGILDHQADWGAGGASLENTRQDAHKVRLAPLGREFGRAGLAQVQQWLNVRFGKRQAGRAAIDHRANGRPMAFAPGSKAKDATEAVETHVSSALFFQSNVRCIFSLHADDVIARIDMMDFAGHPCRQVREKVQARAANILDRDVATQRRI